MIRASRCLGAEDMEKTIREICLLCKGERWLDDPLQPGRSRACHYCDAQGWVLVAESNFSSPETQPEDPEKRKID
jgi:hypothetical protein